CGLYASGFSVQSIGAAGVDYDLYRYYYRSEWICVCNKSNFDRAPYGSKRELQSRIDKRHRDIATDNQHCSLAAKRNVPVYRDRQQWRADARGERDFGSDSGGGLHAGGFASDPVGAAGVDYDLYCEHYGSEWVCVCSKSNCDGAAYGSTWN